MRKRSQEKKLFVKNKRNEILIFLATFNDTFVVILPAIVTICDITRVFFVLGQTENQDLYFINNIT